MVPRQHVYDTFWRFAAVRQEIFFARLRGDAPPWCDDPIFNTYKFCNSYRASDRVSQYLIRNVIYGGDRDSPDGSFSEEDTIFRIVLFKIFNRIETWERLEEKIGRIKLSGFDFERYCRALEEIRRAGQPIYTSAYMSCASKAFGHDLKHRNHLALIARMFVTDRIAGDIISARSLEAVYQMLLEYPLIGRFTAYQMAIDINYSTAIDFSENEFMAAGPGAERGIRKCFMDTGGRSDSYVIRWMVDRQEQEFDRLGIRFKNLWGRPLHAIDCQNLFCETDKYCRAAYPELSSNRTRIKARFIPNPVPIEYFYSPKWGINSRVQEDFGARRSRTSDPVPPLQTALAF